MCSPESNKDSTKKTNKSLRKRTVKYMNDDQMLCEDIKIALTDECGLCQ